MRYFEDLGTFLYEVGDKVTVTSEPLEDYENYYTGVRNATLAWMSIMSKYRGKVVTILKVDMSDGTYRIEEDDQDFWWCNAFFVNPCMDINEDDIDDSMEGSCEIEGFLDGFEVAK